MYLQDTQAIKRHSYTNACHFKNKEMLFVPNFNLKLLTVLQHANSSDRLFHALIALLATRIFC